jgi:hypothetical protein
LQKTVTQQQLVQQQSKQRAGLPAAQQKPWQQQVPQVFRLRNASPQALQGRLQLTLL